MTAPRSGYTLPVFACAAAIAALQRLRSSQPMAAVSVQLLEPAETAEIGIEQVARLGKEQALAITRSDPGDNLDLTRNTPIWALVEWGAVDQQEPIMLVAGEGVGRSRAGELSISRYARRLFLENLQPLLQPEERLQVTIILPEGQELAKRTSNEAFGVVEGLSLLGTSGISQPLSAPGQLQAYRQELRQKRDQFEALVFCVGENGLDLSQRLGVDPDRLIKTANWLGPLLVEAGIQGVKSILLFGYHGKLLKLAGGIFHTHHHVADGRLEILTAYCANAGLPTAEIQKIFACPTAEDGLAYLRGLDDRTGRQWVNTVYGAIAATIDRRSQAYIRTHCDRSVTVGTVLFDRQRHMITTSMIGHNLLKQVCQSR
ncbi:MAG: cobalt-precorrin-5B (C(1))-methyltransferase CbiD [Leptodesmis sp.]|uniref:cobalt-precorrin-5B (C(1))-methyltransferase CbiD n=1 Tax=Leptodesmis sp. TaxID=3100501 RepID=UPI003D1263B1